MGIQKKILDFQNNVDTIKKDATNPHFKNKYATLSHILETVKPILNALQCTVTQPIIGGEVKTIITDTESGESIEASITLPAGLTPQQAGSAITYYSRYTIKGLLALEIDDDDDGNSASTNATEKTEELPWLTAAQFEAMVKSINEGKKDQVIERLTKYRLKKEYKSAIDLAIKNN